MITDNFKTLCHKSRKSDFRSATCKLTLARCINMLIELNEMMNNRSSIKNDFSSYRRYSIINWILPGTAPVNVVTHFFLASQQSNFFPGEKFFLTKVTKLSLIVTEIHDSTESPSETYLAFAQD